MPGNSFPPPNGGGPPPGQYQPLNQLRPPHPNFRPMPPNYQMQGPHYGDGPPHNYFGHQGPPRCLFIYFWVYFSFLLCFGFFKFCGFCYLNVIFVFVHSRTHVR